MAICICCRKTRQVCDKNWPCSYRGRVVHSLSTRAIAGDITGFGYRQRPATLLALAALVPSAASAHVGVGDTSGFVHGFGHPIGGVDHLLAMVMIGLFAWQLGGRALWLGPRRSSS